MSLLRRSLRPLLHLTGPMEPSIIIVGARKAGTTALFNMLAKHPDAAPPDIKELMFFHREEAYRMGMQHYHALFPPRNRWSGNEFTFEASVPYLEHPEVPARIKRHLPRARIAMVLRDPVSRAYSDWNMFRQFKDHPRYASVYDPRGFEEAMEAELENRSGQGTWAYLETGHYAVQLRRWLRHYRLKDLSIFGFGEFTREPRRVVDQLLRRTGRSAARMPDAVFGEKANVRGYDEALSPAMAQRLRTHCAAWQQELEELLGRKFPLD